MEFQHLMTGYGVCVCLTQNIVGNLNRP